MQHSQQRLMANFHVKGHGGASLAQMDTSKQMLPHLINPLAEDM